MRRTAVCSPGHPAASHALTSELAGDMGQNALGAAPLTAGRTITVEPSANGGNDGALQLAQVLADTTHIVPPKAERSGRRFE